MILMRHLLLALAIAAPVLGATPLKVVTLHTILTELAQEIGGGHVTVVPLVKAGMDPHGFEPTPVDIRQLKSADLVLAVGLNSETYLNRLAPEIPPGRLVRVGDDLPGLIEGRCEHEHHHDHHDHGFDHHWWHGITQMHAAVERVARELTARRPAAAADFARNAAAYRERLEGLRTWIVAELAVLPGERRLLVTSHNAFAYFAAEHGFAVHPLLGSNTVAEADARQVASVVRLIRRHGIRTVFAESSVNPRLVEAIARDTGAKFGPLLYADGLGLGAAATYEGMMRHNVSTIVAGLR